MIRDVGGIRSLLRRPVFVAAAVLIPVAFFQMWIVSAGRFWDWPQYSAYYCKLTDAFLHGQTSLRQTPPPGLLALPNPYDTRVNERFLKDCYDMVLFQGKLYLYWGPVPALLATAVCLILGISHPRFGDQYLTFIFMFGTILMATILMLQVKSRLFPRLPAAAIAPAVLSLGLGIPVLHTLARAAIYESAIAAGQFFLLAGFCAAWNSLAHRRPIWLIPAGICWALSAGSRISLWPAVTAVIAITLWAMHRLDRQENLRRPRLGAMFCLTLPFLSSAALAGGYNFARFHSFTEFGLRYQAAIMNQFTVLPDKFLSLQYVIPNLYLYLFSSPTWMGMFPYLNSVTRRPWIACLFHCSMTIGYEPIIGIAWSQPFILFAPLGLAAFWWRKPSCADPTTSERLLAVWLITSLCAAAAIGFVPVLTFHWLTTRYLLDAVPCCTVLAALGYWQVLTSFAWPARTAREVGSIAKFTALGQSLMGLLMGLHGFREHFMTQNPTLYKTLSDCFRWLRF